MAKIKVDIIIPVYKPGAELGKLLYMLCAQTIKPRRIIIMNTVPDLHYESDDLMETAKANPELLDMLSDETASLLYMVKSSGAARITEVHNIRESEFNHGVTRNKALENSRSEYFICMTQDAIPQDETLIDRLLAPFEDNEYASRIVMTYARQIAKKDADPIERITREFNYPDKSRIKTRDDLRMLGIKTFFASNVCAAYRRDAYEKTGGFIKTDFNEDMIYARGVINAGYAIKYCADACVIHSHNLSGIEQFKRNHAIAKSQKEHPEIFGDVKSESEGIALVKTTASRLQKEGKWYLLPKLVWQSGWKYLGYKL